MTDAQFIAWLKDSSAIRCALVEVNVRSGGSETTRYLSNKGYVTTPTDTPANTRYAPYIVGGIKFTETLSLEGSASLSFGDIEIDNTSGERDAWFDDVWSNRSIKVYIGDVRWARSDFRLIFDGITAAVDSRSRTTINLKVSDKMQRLNTPVTENKLGGTTNNADKLIPLCFGECFNVEPLLVDATVNEYQVHDGQIESIIEVRDNGVPVTFTPFLTTGKFRLAKQPDGQITASVQGAKRITQRLGTNLFTNGTFNTDISGWATSGGVTWDATGKVKMTNVDAIDSAISQDVSGLKPGRKYVLTGTAASVSGTPAWVWQYYNSISSVQYGGGAFGVGSFSVTFTASLETHKFVFIQYSDGAHSGTLDNLSIQEVYEDVGYFNNIASIVRELATQYGTASTRLAYTDLDTKAIGDFETANQQPVGLYLKERTNVIEAMNKLATSVGGRCLITRSGLLSLLKLTLPQSVLGTTVKPSDMVMQSLAVSQLPAVDASVKIGYCKNWTVQSTITAGVFADHAAMYKEEWLTLTRTDTATQTNYKTFVEPVLEETLLLVGSDASNEANRRLNMYNVQRKAIKYVGMPWLMLETLGAAQTVVNSRFGLTNGVTGQIISLATDWLNPHITVEVLI